MSDGADITIHMPKAFLWSVLFVFAGQLFAGVWFASTMTAQVRSNMDDIQLHGSLGAHSNADIRIARLEVLVNSFLAEENESQQILRDIRDKLGE